MKNIPTTTEIRKIRTENKLTQSAAAEIIYSTRRTWQDWELGNAHMHPGLWELFNLKLPKKPTEEYKVYY